MFRRRRRGELPSSDRVFDTPAVDLTDAAPSPGGQWGLPTHCPECGTPGYLDSIDMNRRVMHQHCPKCWHKWATTEADVRSGAAK